MNESTELQIYYLQRKFWVGALLIYCTWEKLDQQQFVTELNVTIRV